MRRISAGLAVALAAVAAGASAAAAAPTTPAAPTPRQVHRALTRASRSSYLWATVNICEPKPHGGGLIGVRGEMPALGFPATLSMTIALDQYVVADKRFEPVTGATARRTVVIGRRSRGVHQVGAAFPYASATGILDATVTFTWTRDGRTLGQATRTTTGGHPSAAFGRPPHSSTDRCRL